MQSVVWALSTLEQPGPVAGLWFSILSPGLHKQNQVTRQEEDAENNQAVLGPCVQTNALEGTRAPESIPRADGTQHILTSRIVTSLCPSATEEQQNAPFVLCRVAVWPLLSPRLGWKVCSLQRNMLRQAQPAWPHIKSILGWKQIKS